MARPQIQIEMRKKESMILGKYSFWSKLFILLIILLIILLAVVFLGIYIFGYAYNWALFSLDAWIILISVLCVVFILVELFFYFNFSSVVKKRVELETPKPEFIDGKKVHVYTYPIEAEGGVFSKTYIEIDKNNIIRIRLLIISPDELWGSKEI